MVIRRRSLFTAAIICFVLWFGSSAYQYAFQIGGPKPLYAYVALLALTGLWLMSTGRLPGMDKPGVLALQAWLGLYLVYGCLAFLHSTQDDIAAQAFVTLVEAVLLSAAFVMLFAEAERLRRVQITLAALAVLATAINVVDFLHPVFTNVPGRAAGMYGNPNISGHFIAMAMAAGCSVIPRRGKLFFVLLCGMGVFLTFSRASWILWALALMLLGWKGYIGSLRRRWIAMLLGCVIGISFLGLVFTGGLGSMMSGTSFAAHLDPNTQARLGISASSLSGHSASLREKLIHGSLVAASDAPLFGYGLGYTAEWQYPVGPHDMYLLFLVEGGIPGALLYLALMALLWRYSTGVGRIVALQLLIAGVFTHNQLEQPAFQMMMAFVVAQHSVVRMQSKRSGADAPNASVRA